MTWSTSEVIERTTRLREEAGQFFYTRGGLPPMVFVFATTPEQRVFLVVPDRNEDGRFEIPEKETFAEKVRSCCRQHQAVAACAFWEAWTLPEDLCADEAKAISDHAERQEIIGCHLDDQRKGNRLWRADILRDAEGKPRLTPWVEAAPLAGALGRLGSFLPLTS